MSGKKHLIWMAIGFLVLLVLSSLVGVSAWLLFPFLCLFMMVMMMAMMGHSDEGK